MNLFASSRVALKRIPRIALSGQGRFIVLILVFNVLLVVTLILSMQRQELIQEYEWVSETRTIIEELVTTLEAIEPVTVTRVVEPGFTPPPTLTGQ